MITNHVGFYYSGTTAERTALSPKASSVFFDTDTGDVYSWDGSAWQRINLDTHDHSTDALGGTLPDGALDETYLQADGSVALADAWDMGSQVITNANIDTGAIDNAVTHAEWDAAVDHISADGSSHGHIDQAVTVASTPTLAGLTLVNAITEFSTDDTLGGDSDSAVPTEQAVKAYVDAVGGGIEVQEDDVKVLDATIINFEGGTGKVTDEGGGKATVDITGGGGGGAPVDYPYLGFGTDGDLDAEVDLYEFYGSNLIKNSPGQIVVDGAEPQWWDDVANATLTDEDAAGEACSDLFERVFKVVTVADDVYGYQTLTFADEALLDAGATVVSLGVWVWCDAATTASVAIYGTNLGLQESTQHGGGSNWELLTVEAQTLDGADTSIQVRLIVDTDTAFFAAPMLNTGPKTMPWKARDIRYIAIENVVQLNLANTGDVAHSDTDCTGNTDNLAVAISARARIVEPNGTLGSWLTVSHDSAIIGADSYTVWIQSNAALGYYGTGYSAWLSTDDGQILRYSVSEADADSDVSADIYISGYWMWA